MPPIINDQNGMSAYQAILAALDPSYKFNGGVFSNPDAPPNGNTGWIPGSGPNAGQTDSYGNVYLPVAAGSWGGGYVDPGTLPGRSTVNAQLWGGETSDSAPAWLKKIVQEAKQLTGEARKTRIQHILDSLLTPGSGANRHDLGYAEREFGLVPPMAQ